jgi:hypothetical protein
MAKRPLLRGNRVRSAAALLLSMALCVGATLAHAEGESSGSDLKSSENPPAEEKKPSADKTQAEEGAKNKAEPAQATEQKDAKQTPAGDAPLKPAEAKAERARPAEPKETATGKPAAAKEKSAEPKETKVEKPRDLTPKTEAGELVVRASTVDALYRISWLGAHIGDFRLRSSIANKQYSLHATADISVFFGTYTWEGATTSSGALTASGPVPQNYMFRYATGSRRETVELRFQQKMVQDISINPPAYPGSRRVPITAAHLQNVVDPLSALVLLSQARVGREDACNKRLPIFDGRIRYDLVFSPKGTRTINAAGRLRGTAYVCSVRYVPVAGHKMGKPGENDYATGNTGIEVWLVPVPEAGLIVPYYIHVPTPAGTASMVTAKFDVQAPAGRHALAE